MRTRGKLTWLAAWSVAFGVVEGAVVVYLRRLFYPGAAANGPLFPLRDMGGAVALTEVVREAATLVMLLGVAMLAERRPLRRFAAFAFCFGVWDLVYYAMLWLALRWPSSLLEWDILFLIPAPWAAPVLAPVLVSLALVGAAVLVLWRVGDAEPSPFRPFDWAAQAACGALVLWSFFWNAGPILRMELPGGYPWGVFLAGWLGGLLVFARAWRRTVAGRT
jgi:hypothetical protein